MNAVKEPNVFDVTFVGCYYQLRHIPTNGRAHLGDGVDAMLDHDGNAISAGTHKLIEAWEEMFNEDVPQTLETYFPDLVES